ncbi:hypothetical protein [Parasitella parasitica]|uniref:DDE Tnp4 domain-containing protein n=1 Tax=Parasitella parasitica TaxID=35722 RepID=A0A0B7N796_9FUNG|nr:hypothetical protein [Parasitella parasitica]
MAKTTVKQDVVDILRARKALQIKKCRRFVKVVDLINHLEDLHLHTRFKDIPKRSQDSSQFSTKNLQLMFDTLIEEDPESKLLQKIENERYFFSRKIKGYKKRNVINDIEFVEAFLAQDEVKFRRGVRMGKEAFNALYETIKNDTIFVSKSGAHQRSIKLQMIVALTRLGLYGNGKSNKRLQTVFGIAHGTVDKYFERFQAAVLRLQSKYVHWPSCSERKKIIEKHYREYGLPDCLGFIDGSLISMYKGPGWHREKFFSRKMKYAMQSVFICDSDLRILYNESGHYRSMNDPGVMSYGIFHSKIDEYFEGKEYVVGDSAYKRTSWCIPIKKEGQDGGLTHSDEKFNYFLSQARVRVDHCFAALKGKFASLEVVQVTVNSRDDVLHMVKWLQLCSILHNFCLGYDTPSYIAELIDKFQKSHEDINKCFTVEYNRRVEFTDDAEGCDVEDAHDSNGIFNDETDSDTKWRALKERVLTEKGYSVAMSYGPQPPDDY